jgi:uncharacterized phage protein gp47/JayE
MLADMAGEWNTREGSFAYDMAAPVALELWKMRVAMEELIGRFYIDENSGVYIDKQAAMLGLSRKPAVCAHAVVTFYGEEGMRIPSGLTVETGDGVRFTLPEGGEIGDEDLLELDAVCDTAGSVGNVSSGEVQISPAVAGVTAQIGEGSGGLDEETDRALVTRFYERLQKPATSGNIWHYHEWAKSCNGIAYASVVGLGSGAGTVDIYVTGADGEEVSEDDLLACAEEIDAQRPVGATVIVQNASIIQIDVSASITRGDRALSEIRAEWLSALEELIEQARQAFDSGCFAEGGQLPTVATLKYQRVLGALYAIDGVEAVSRLELCGGSEDIALYAREFAVLHQVEVRDNAS